MATMLELVFSPHFLGIAVEVTSSGPPLVEDVIVSKAGHSPCKNVCCKKSSFGASPVL